MKVGLKICEHERYADKCPECENVRLKQRIEESRFQRISLREHCTQRISELKQRIEELELWIAMVRVSHSDIAKETDVKMLRAATEGVSDGPV